MDLHFLSHINKKDVFMSKCSNCGAELDAGAKFCMECGTPVPQVKKCVQCGMELPLKAKFCFGCGAPQEGAATAVGAGVSMGDKNVVAGDVIGQKIAGDSVGNKIMGNATFTTIQDDTKRVNTCYVCGKHLTNDNGHTCPKCGNIVCDEHFDRSFCCCVSCVKKEKGEIIVDKSGRGDAKTISEAISLAKEGETVLVRSGTYEENIVVDKDLAIIGELDSEGKYPVICGNVKESDNCIALNAQIVLKNLSITQVEYGIRGNIADALGCNIVQTGEESVVTFENCDIFEGSYGTAVTGVCICGKKAILKNCRIHGFGRTVLKEVHGGCQGLCVDIACYSCRIEDCEIFDCGIGVDTGWDPYRFLRKKAVDSGSRITFENCEIMKNARGIVGKGEKTILTFKGGKVYKNNGEGFAINDGCQGTICNCEVFNNEEEGVLIRDTGTNVVVRDCRIYDNNEKVWNFNKGKSIYAENGAKVSIENCDVLDKK